MEANNISTHAPRTGSDVAAIYEFVETPEISTHAPRTGSDGLLVQPHSRLAPFQPTLPARGATRDGMGNPAGQRISTHAPRTGSDTIPLFSAFVQRHFNPRSPHGERRHHARKGYEHEHFNPRSPHGERHYVRRETIELVEFQPTLPARGATKPVSAELCALYFNPRSPHGERHWERVGMGADRTISTHAPRTGSDLFGLKQMQACQRDFNPRSPHGERLAHTAFFHHAPIFQPTLPARGATEQKSGGYAALKNFNPRSPHGERPALLCAAVLHIAISTHAPRTGSDKHIGKAFRDISSISTHAPRTGSDIARRAIQNFRQNFNPRSPHGERRGGAGKKSRHARISTHAPRTGSDNAQHGGDPSNKSISTHAPRTGSDDRTEINHIGLLCISTHAPRTGSDFFRVSVWDKQAISTHAPRTGSDRRKAMYNIIVYEFQPTLPARGATEIAAIQM